MVRNLCSNALKYTRSGKILLGCRRRGSVLRIEIWDTGLGIAGEELGSIFDEYHQVVGPGRERSRGLGLGLSIVKRLGDLLGHKVLVKSQPGKGSVFSIEVPMALDPLGGNEASPHSAVDTPAEQHLTGSILVVEDDPEVLNLLAMLVRDEGHLTATASDGAAALALIDDGLFQPDLVLADLSLPNGLDGLAVATHIRERLERVIPVIILTGDMSTDSLRDISRANCVQMHKPVSPGELTQTIQRELAVARSPAEPSSSLPRTVAKGALPGGVFVVDDDPQLLHSIRMIFEAEGRDVKTFGSGEDFLAAVAPEQDGCLLVDSLLPGMSGLELVESMRSSGHTIPAIMITGNSDVATAIAAMKAGAIDFIEKPISRIDLLASVERGLALSRSLRGQRTLQNSAARHIASLTARQRQIMTMVLAGEPSKNIAADLGISQRTVENHRAAIMKKTGTKSLPALARLVLSVETFSATADLKPPSTI